MANCLRILQTATGAGTVKARSVPRKDPAMTVIRYSLVCCVLVTMARADDWPNWRGPQANGISRESGWRDQWPDKGPPILWKGTVGTGFSSVVVSNGLLYTLGNADNTDTVFCLSADDGKLKWSHSYESPLDDRFFEGGPTSTPTVDGNAVYTLGRQGHLFCFERTSGKVLWKINLAEDFELPIPGWGFGGSPVVRDKLLLLNAGAAGLALDKSNGKLVWASDSGEAGYTTPVIARSGQQELMILASKKFFQAVDLKSGELLWKYRWLTRFGCNAADPIVSGQQVFISSGYSRGAAVLTLADAEPAEVWKNKELQNQFSSSVLIESHLYGFDGNDTGSKRLRCLDFATGKVVWSEDWEGMGALTAADGKLIALSEAGDLVVAPASPKGLAPTARATVIDGKCWTVPVLANGIIYCRNADGQIVAVDVRASQP